MAEPSEQTDIILLEDETKLAEKQPLQQTKRNVSFALLDETGRQYKNKTEIEEAANVKDLTTRKKNRAALKRFLDHEEFTYQSFEVKKSVIFKKAFTQELHVIYDKNASQVEKLREVLLSPQLNLVIIVLIVVDWCFAVVELFTDFIPNKTPSVRVFEQTMTYFSIAIIGFFLIEVFAKIVIVPKYFFSSKLEMFDGLIVIVGFCLEIFFAIKKRDFESVGSILTIFRFWRILRIINSKITTEVYQFINLYEF
jgi:hypothetical protein